jgi:hypothetical protein
MIRMFNSHRAASSSIALAPLLALAFSLPTLHAQTPTPSASSAPAVDNQPGVLNRTQAAAILPEKVFYSGQTAPIQGRNSAGIRFPGGKLFLAALVDTSGYSTAVQQKYQGYLLLEVPVEIGGKTLPPGAYGFGFVSGDTVVVMDIGGNELLHTNSVPDPGLHRPNPLQILPDSSAPGHYRLYLGRSYVTLSARE